MPKKPEDKIEFVGEDVYLEFTKKLALTDHCFACGEADKIPVGGDNYVIVAAVKEDGKTEEYNAVYWCPRHLTELGEQLLLHLYRVATEREPGAIRLPLMKLMEKEEAA